MAWCQCGGSEAPPAARRAVARPAARPQPQSESDLRPRAALATQFLVISSSGYSRQQTADSRISTELWIVAEPVRGQPGSSGFCQVILESMVFFTLAIQLSCVTLIKLKLIAS